MTSLRARRTRWTVFVASLLCLAFALGMETQSANDRYDVHAGERAVAALPGIGQGWIDTLRLVVGDPTVTIDTINVTEIRSQGPNLLGLMEPYHNIVSIRLPLIAYTQFIRGEQGPHHDDFGWWGDDYHHPVTVATPAGVVAHEFGHAFQESLLPWRQRDTMTAMPAWAHDFPERFADRFARVMLALRGWDAPDTADVILYHVVRARLWRATR